MMVRELDALMVQGSVRVPAVESDATLGSMKVLMSGWRWVGARDVQLDLMKGKVMELTSDAMMAQGLGRAWAAGSAASSVFSKAA